VPLTPTDVANKQFRIAFRGYSLDEVDAFLDEVESELSRLLRDNAGLRDRPEATSGASADSSAKTPEPAARPLQGLEGQEAALRTLLLAQRTADEAIAEAQAEAERIVTSARSEADTALGSARSEAESTLTSSRSEAERTLGSARTEAERTLGSARTEADSTLRKARAEAESTLQTAQAKAARVDEDVAERIQAATGGLEQRRRELEVRIEELRSFEREYRTRLKAYLETQLRDLDSKQGPDDGGAGVPAGARSAAVGLTPGGAAGVRPRTADAPAPAASAGPAAPAASAGAAQREGGAGAVAAAAGPAAAGSTSAAPPAPGASASTQDADAAAEPDEQDEPAPSGPPREAEPAAPRVAPTWAVSPPQTVGPFSPRPATGPQQGA